MPASDDLTLLLDTVAEAARIAHRFWNDGAVSWEKPGNQGPVTEADLAVDTFLRDTLCAARPDYGWLSEESLDDPARLTARRVFVVDPIDGTRAFANGERTWAISVAVVEDGTPTAAVIQLPVRNLTYSAARGQGGLLNNEVPLVASARTDITGAEILANRPTMDPAHWPGGVPPVRRCFRSALAYRMALIGEGRFDAMITFRRTWEWDIAAGALIAAEAGATVTDARGDPIRFNSPARQTPGILAAAPAIHESLLNHSR